ncbi:hypothetical protein JB92DRAFT_3122627 [Gautieria morchelliformis]|nr:hypothetical protein JB92DRAFT_3122627 [Gautieria morchelliformis]
MAKDEVEIDAALGRIRQIWKCMMMRVRGLLEHVASGQGPREAMAGGAGVRYQPPGPEPAGPTQLAYTLWQTYGPDLTGLLYSPSKPPSPPSSPFPSTSAPPSQPQPHDSRVRGTTPAIDMHPDAMLLAQRRALEAKLSPLPRPNPHGEAHVFLIAQPALPHSPRQSAMPRAASSTEEIGSVDEGEGVGDDRGGARASSGWW